MNHYRAPRQDVQFILTHHLEASVRDAVAAESELDPELMIAITDEAARFAEEVLAPLNAPGDRQGCRLENGRVATPDGWSQAYQQFRDMGWTGLNLPTELGGQGLPGFLAMPVNEFWQSANLAFSMIQPLTQGSLAALQAAGTPEPLAKYGEKLARGEYSATMALTEAAAGSDLGELTTRAQPQADGSWAVTGEKIYISYGQHDFSERIIHLVLARLPDAPSGSRGLSLLAVPSTLDDGTPNGVTCTGIEEKMGLHGSPTCTLTFDHADAELIGEPHQGLRIMFVMMNDARLNVGLQGVAILERAYQSALAWARERRQGKAPGQTRGPTALVNHPDIRRLLLRLRSQTLAARLLGYSLGLRLDQARLQPDHQTAQQEADLLLPVFKAWSTEAASRLSADAIQILGGMGFIEETGVSQFYRDIKVSTLYEGTTGIQAQDFLFRKILRDQGAAFSQWLQGVRHDFKALHEIKSSAPDVEPWLHRVNDLEATVDGLLADRQEDLAFLHAGAVSLLLATGILAGGWQLARAVQAAQAPAVSADYRADLQAIFTFYSSHWQPDIRAELARVTQADAGLASYRFDSIP